eukprot:8512493-Pyramimonas_sp.AAC.1
MCCRALLLASGPRPLPPDGYRGILFSPRKERDVLWPPKVGRRLHRIRMLFMLMLCSLASLRFARSGTHTNKFSMDL